MFHNKIGITFAGLFIGAIACLGASSSVAAAGIDVTPSSASVAPGEIIQFRADPDQSCWKLDRQPLATPVYRWTISDASAAVVVGPTDVVGTEFVSGLLEISLPAPQIPGTYTFNWTGINECAGDNGSATFVVTGTAPTTVATTVATTTTVFTAPVGLPATGQEVSLSLLALVFLLGGGGLVVATRRN